MKAVTKLTAIAILLAAIGGWLYYTPYLAVKNMREAAERKDSATLSRYINYPSLRESLKATLNASMLSKIGKQKDTSPFAALGTALVMALIGPMVDAMITPEALAMMMKGEKPALKEKGKPAAAPASAASDRDVETLMGYESFDQFVVSAKKKGTADEPIALVFQREGIWSWKLTAIRLPL
jgi:DUF2939 family protein